MKSFAFSWLIFITSLYGLLLVALTVLNWSGADRWWPAALNLYLPQVIWALPGFLLTIIFLKMNRGWIWLPLFCLVWALGPVMGLRWSVKSRPPQGSTTLRVMTWNIKYGFHDLVPLVEEMARTAPDVVIFQDAGGALKSPLLVKSLAGWQVRSKGQYLIASKYPLSQIEELDLPSWGEEQKFLRCQLHLGPTIISLYNVHFKTPRDSLNAFRKARHIPWYLPSAIERFKRNVSTRQLQAVAVSRAVSGEKGPVIVAGDLNSPDASLVCKTLRDGGLRNAFSEAGRGYGYTYGHFLLKYRLPWLKVSWMRIDHILASEQFESQSCQIGTGQASDHRPVIADLVVRRPSE